VELIDIVTPNRSTDEEEKLKTIDVTASDSKVNRPPSVIKQLTIKSQTEKNDSDYRIIKSIKKSDSIKKGIETTIKSIGKSTPMMKKAISLKRIKSDRKDSVYLTVFKCEEQIDDMLNKLARDRQNQQASPALTNVQIKLKNLQEQGLKEIKKRLSKSTNNTMTQDKLVVELKNTWNTFIDKKIKESADGASIGNIDTRIALSMKEQFELLLDFRNIRSIVEWTETYDR
jgi:uncharacterized membrane protein YheB (UPF0754 family)